MAGARVAYQGLPARICWLGQGQRDLVGLRFNELVSSGAVAAPIVIGRDHLDCGSVASPYRETEAMADGSDAIADWPLLNALVSTASGATWVSIHSAGHTALGWPGNGVITPGAACDLVAVRTDSPRTAGCLLEQLPLAATACDVDTVVVGGRVVAQEGRRVELGDVGTALSRAIDQVWACAAP
jgi:hypothetical protein